jgi:GH25 family lysozyme M1 (1,4-beta-N-acetylmuramidase)
MPIEQIFKHRWGIGGNSAMKKITSQDQQMLIVIESLYQKNGTLFLQFRKQNVTVPVCSAHEFVDHKPDVVEGVDISSGDMGPDIPQNVAQGVGRSLFL